MARVVRGTDLYGAVRKVGRTPIVTRFHMLQLLPTMPIASYYLKRLGPTEHTGIPFVLGQTHQSFSGLPLARIDRLSVAIAYVRGLAATIGLLGFTILLIMLVSSRNARANPTDPVQLYAVPVGVAMLVSGIVVGAASYYFTFALGEREKRIRHECGEVLGMAADPAQVEADTARTLMRSVREILAKQGITEPTRAVSNLTALNLEQLRLLLVIARGMLAVSDRREQLEQLTDSLLGQIGSLAEH